MNTKLLWHISVLLTSCVEVLVNVVPPRWVLLSEKEQSWTPRRDGGRRNRRGREVAVVVGVGRGEGENGGAGEREGVAARQVRELVDRARRRHIEVVGRGQGGVGGRRRG